MMEPSRRKSSPLWPINRVQRSLIPTSRPRPELCKTRREAAFRASQSSQKNSANRPNSGAIRAHPQHRTSKIKHLPDNQVVKTPCYPNGNISRGLTRKVTPPMPCAPSLRRFIAQGWEARNRRKHEPRNYCGGIVVGCPGWSFVAGGVMEGSFSCPAGFTPGTSGSAETAPRAASCRSMP